MTQKFLNKTKCKHRNIQSPSLPSNVKHKLVNVFGEWIDLTKFKLAPYVIKYTLVPYLIDGPQVKNTPVFFDKIVLIDNLYDYDQLQSIKSTNYRSKINNKNNLDHVDQIDHEIQNSIFHQKDIEAKNKIEKQPFKFSPILNSHNTIPIHLDTHISKESTQPSKNIEESISPDATKPWIKAPSLPLRVNRNIPDSTYKKATLFARTQN
ncbi:hypothetical protein HZS_6452, partial [Henneguya salminicola]